MAIRTDSRNSSGGRLVAADGRELVLRSTSLAARAGGGLARVELRQTFGNPYDEPLRVHYSLPLPPTGAVAGYTVTVGGRIVRGEIERREEARAQFEEALLDGKVASLLEEERSALFTQQLGNLPPRTDVEVLIEVDQGLDWVEGGWEWRFPTVVAPRYLGGKGEVSDADAVTIDVLEGAMPCSVEFQLVIEDEVTGSAFPSSPSHPVTWSDRYVRLAQETGATLDRDIVVRWPVATADSGSTLRTARSAVSHARSHQAFGLLTVTPPAAPFRSVVRDLILLLDTSGSMSGLPLEHAREVAKAVVASLGPRDSLQMIAFSSQPRSWNAGPVPMTPETARAAIQWIGALQAGGGTEMATAMIEAMKPLRAGAQRQVVLVTDGQIGFEERVCREIATNLPGGCRVHTVGIGSAVNRTLTRGAAREGRGAEILIGLDEAPAAGAMRVVRALDRPVLVDLEVEGDALVEKPDRLPDVMAASPVLIPLCLRSQGGELIVRGHTPDGVWIHRLQVAAIAPGDGEEAIARHYGRDRVESREAVLAWGGESDSEALLAEIEALGLAFRIATRRTSWVAISSEPVVDPTLPTRELRIPQQLPAGMDMRRLGLVGSVLMQRAAASPESGLFSLPELASQRRRQMDGLRMGFRPLPSGSSERVLRGHWRTPLVRTGRVLEFTIDGGDLAWELVPRARVQLRSGSWVYAEILPKRSTRSGTVREGSTIRVALDLTAEVAEAAIVVEFLSPPQRVRIEL